MRHRDAFGALTASARPRSGEPASIPKQSSTLAKRPPEPSGAATTAFVTVSKARPNALAISAAGVAMRVYALRAAAHGAVEAYKIILTGQAWEAYEARADANVEKKVVAAQLDVFGK